MRGILCNPRFIFSCASFTVIDGSAVFRIFPRYLLKRFLHVFAVGFVSLYGLFVIIDAFTNVNGFQSDEVEMTTSELLLRMLSYYTFQSSQFLDLIGAILCIVSVVAVLTMMVKQGEIWPILSAGVPTHRVVVPLMFGAVIVNLLLIANRELVIPRISHQLQGRRDAGSMAKRVEPAYDFQSRILVSGQTLKLSEQRMYDAEFVLPVPTLAEELTALKAEEATFYPAKGKRPAGWKLSSPSPGYDELKLTEEGRRHVLPVGRDGDLFVVADVACDRLSNRKGGYRYLSTWELIRRIQNSPAGQSSSRAQTLYLHARLTSPLMNLLAVWLAVPFVFRKEARSLILSVAASLAVLGSVYLIAQIFVQLGRANLLRPDLAVWLPILLCGLLAAWSYEWTQT